MHSTMHS